MDSSQIEYLNKCDLKALALNKEKLGPLTFDDAYPILEKLKEIFLELNGLEYDKHLSPRESTSIKNLAGDFISRLRQLENFNIATHPTPKPFRDDFTRQIRNFYDETMVQLRTPLVYLRQSLALISDDAKSLQQEQMQVVEMRKMHEELGYQLQKNLEILKNELVNLEAKKQAVADKHGEVAAKVLALQFEEQSKRSQVDADSWLGARSFFYQLIFWTVLVNFVVYAFWYVMHYLGHFKVPPSDFFNAQYGILKFAFLSILSIGLVFASKNYNIHSNLVDANKHRRNVAQTLDDFLATSTDKDAKAQMLKQGVEAMFKHLPMGHIKREIQSETNLVHEIINNVLPQKD